jgi:hypothetical protein
VVIIHRRDLGGQDMVDVLQLIPVGYAQAQEMSAKKRKSLDEILF